MISREGDLIIFECDGEKCHEHFESQAYIFDDAISRLRETGWKTIQVGSKWLHHCPACHEEWLEKRKLWLSDVANKLKGNL